jgi:hypothetical protein
MSQVEIVVTARNNAAAGLRAAQASVAGLSMRLRDARMRATQLAQAERDAADEVRRLDRVVRFFGSAATEQMRDNLAAAQIRANDLRIEMANVDDEVRDITRHMGQASMAAAAFSVHIRNADREAERLNRQFNRLDNRIRRAVGARIDRLGDSIRQIASSAVSSGIDAVSSGLATAAKYVTLFAAGAPVVAGVLVAVAGAIGDLTGVVATMPAAFLAGAASIGVFKLGLQGISEAFEAGISGDAEKFREAMKGLTREAQDFVAGGLMVRNAWRGVQKAVQSQLFAGLGATIRQVNANLQPLAEKWLPRIAAMFNKAARAVGDFLKLESTKVSLDKIMEQVGRHIEGVLSALPFLAQAFLDIGEVGASMFGDVGQGVGSLAERFANWIRGLKESGELQAWVDRARDAFATLGRIAGDVGRVIAAVFKNGSDEGQTFLENVEKQTTKWAEFMESADGAKLVDSLGTIGAAMGNVIGVIQFLSEVWLGWVAMFEDGVNFWQRGWDSMIQIAMDAVSSILSALVSLLGWIPGIGDKIKQTQRDFEAWRNSATNSISGVQGAINSMHGKTVYIDVIERKYMGGTLGGSGGYRGLASGGLATGMKWVGERGPELVDFGAAGGRVTNHERSREVSRQGGGGPTAVNITVERGSSAGSLADLLLGEIRANRIKLTVNSAGRVAVA